MELGQKNRFTVIATCFNDATLIPQYLANMSKQSIQPVEYIIVDGGSKDNTVEIIKKQASKLNILVRLISKGRMNISQGYNEGIKESNTDIIIVTGIGNSYHPDFFKELLICYETSHANIVYGKTIGNKINKFSDAYNLLYVGGNEGIHTIPTNRGMLVEKGVFLRIGYFYEKFIYAGEDVEFYELAKKNNVSISYTDKAILYWDTPRNVKEFRKQQNVYFVGGLQVYGVNRKLVIRSLITWLLLLLITCSVVMFYYSVFPYLILIACFLMFFCKLKSKNIYGFYMKLYDLFSPLYHFFKYRKYTSKDYRVQR